MPTNHIQNLKELREAIIKVVPEIVTREQDFCPDGLPGCLVLHIKNTTRKIRLADVLIAIYEKYNAGYGNVYIKAPSSIEKDELQIFFEDPELGNLAWNLRADDLDQHPPETISFLHGIICKN